MLKLCPSKSQYLSLKALGLTEQAITDEEQGGVAVLLPQHTASLTPYSFPGEEALTFLLCYTHPGTQDAAVYDC